MLKFSGIYLLLALQFILVNMNNFIADPQLYADLTYFTLFIISFIACYRLNDKDIFAVRSKASGIQDYILALLNKYELGSYGLYYNGNYYHYRHGILVKDSKKLLQAKKEKFVIIKSKSYDKETISKIEQLVGTRWSIINNCFTRIRPLLKEKNKNGKN